MVLSQLTQPIIVIGGGTFGTSTAYHLSTKGYTNVTVLDRFSVPSFEAAGNDINKIVRTEYPEPLFTKLASDARAIWRDSNGLFTGLYHPSGWIIGATDRSKPFVEASMRSAKALGVEPPKLVSTEEIHEKWPIMNGDFEGWKSFWSPNAAWVNAREGIVRMAQKAIDAGVRYVSGSAGYAKQLLYDENQTCVGVNVPMAQLILAVRLSWLLVPLPGVCWTWRIRLWRRIMWWAIFNLRHMRSRSIRTCLFLIIWKEARQLRRCIRKALTNY